MDKEGIDIQAINVNAWGYSAERELARDLIAVQNERIAAAVAKNPDRFVGMATLALQHPDLAADQLDQAVRKLGLRGAAIGGSVEGQELSDRKFDPFWAKAEELGVMLFMHPQQATGTTQNPRLQGKGGLGNTIGNPLETTVFLSHLIFEGTLDRFPGPEDLQRSRRRLPAVLHRPLGRALRPRRRRRLQGAQEKAQRVLQAPAVHRHDDLPRGRPAPPGGGSSAPTTSSTGRTIRSTGRSASTSSSMRRPSAMPTRKRSWAGTW